jgi:hypothetical protein
LALGKKILIVKNATAYTWDWYCHLVVDRASLPTNIQHNDIWLNDTVPNQFRKVLIGILSSFFLPLALSGAPTLG